MFVSKRLNTLVDLIKYETISDIACDHGFISILALSNKNIKKSIACDLNYEPLSKCVKNAKEYGFEDRVEARHFDGLKGLKVQEVDTIIIAGLGGILMEKILSEGDDVVSSTKQLLLQPQSDIPLVRKYLTGRNITVCEQYVKDKGKFYVILDCNLSDTPLIYNEKEILVGKNILKNDDFFEYVAHKIDECKKIQSNLKNSSEKYMELEKYKEVLEDAKQI